MQSRGYKTKTVIDFETTFKADPTNKSGLNMPFNSNTVVATQNLNSSETISGTRNAVQPFMGNESVDGDIVVPVDYNAFGYWLKGIFGQDTVVNKKHTFKIGDTQPSMVIEKQYPDTQNYFKYNGCKIGSLSMDFGGDGELTATMNVMGALETTGSTPYVATPTNVTLDRAGNFQCHISIDGTEVVSVIKEGSLTLNLGLDGTQYCIGDNGTRGDIPEGIISAEINLTALFQDLTLLNKAKNGTETPIDIWFTDGTNTLKFKFAEGLFERTSPSIEGQGGVMVSTRFIAYWKDDSNNSAVVVELTNDKAEVY